MHETNPVEQTMMTPPRGFRSWRDDAYLRIAQAWTARVNSGRLHLTLPSGRTALLGRGGDVEAAIRLKNYRLLWNAMRRGSIGVGESYMAQDFESPDLVNVFRFFIDNKAALSRSSRGLFASAAPTRSSIAAIATPAPAAAATSPRTTTSATPSTRTGSTPA